MDNDNKKNTFGQLSLEQQFQLRLIDREIDNLNIEQAREYLREAFRQILVKENIYREMFENCFL